MTKTIYINGVKRNMTAEEIAAEPNHITFDYKISKLRNKRNDLLAETDWMANSDVTMSDAMRTYRQELRDITNGLTTVEDVEAVVFPTKP